MSNLRKEAGIANLFSKITHSLKGAGSAIKGWKAVTEVGHAASEVGKAGKWGLEVGQFASRYGGKALSIAGNSEKVLASIAKYETHVNNILSKLKVGTLLTENADKTIKVGEQLVKSNMFDNVQFITKFITDNKLKTGVKDFAKYLTDNPEVKAKYAAELGSYIANTFETAAKSSGDFVKALQSSITKLKSGASLNPEKLNQVNGAISNLDKELANGNLVGIAKTIANLGDDALIPLAKNAQDSAKFVESVSGNLKDVGLLSLEGRAVASTLTSAVKGFQFVSLSHAVTLKNVGALSSGIGLILFGTSLMGGGLVGENVKLCKELKDITSKIIEEINKLPTKNDAAGKTWEDHKKRIVTSLSQLDSIDIGAYERVNGNNMSASDMETTIMGVQDLSKRFEVIGSTLNEIVNSKSLESLYEGGASSITQDTAAYLDNMNPLAVFGLTGYLSTYNTIKRLAGKGLELLQESGEKISQSTEALNSKLMEDDIGSIKTTEASIVNEFVITAGILDQLNNYTEIDRIQTAINKKAIAFGAVVGALEQVWTIGEIIGESSNVGAKLFIHMSDLWDKLDTNVNEIVEHLQNFNEFKPENSEGEQFKNNTNELIQSIQANLKTVSENIPLENQEQLEKVTKDNLNKAKVALTNLSKAYELFMSKQWEEQYSKHAKSWWQSAVTGVGTLFTMFSGESILDRYSRMVYEARPGTVMINTLLKKVTDLLSQGESAQANS